MNIEANSTRSERAASDKLKAACTSDWRVPRKQRPHVRIVPGAWLNQAVFESPKCRKVRHSSLVLCLRRRRQPPSRAQREQEARAYWDSLTEAREVWALRKMGYFKIGQRA
jgi:hypothetical protein